MIDIKDAYEKAKNVCVNMGLHISDYVGDDGEWFFFGVEEKVDIGGMPSVNKKTGELDIYFPPHHSNFINAKTLIKGQDF